MRKTEAIERIKNDDNILGVRLFWDKKDYSICKKNAKYNIYDTDFKKGLINHINSFISPIHKIELIYDEADLKYNAPEKTHKNIDKTDKGER